MIWGSKIALKWSNFSFLEYFSEVFPFLKFILPELEYYILKRIQATCIAGFIHWVEYCFIGVVAAVGVCINVKFQSASYQQCLNYCCESEKWLAK